MTETKESWGSRTGLILAMAGNAVGLGNFLRFPVQAVNNGGGEFIIPYLVCFLLMGIPLLLVEWGMGKFGGKNGDHSTPFILDNLTKKSFWKYFGVFGLFTNFGVIAYYTYIESWTLSYVLHSIFGTFQGMNTGDLQLFFSNYIGSSGESVFNTPTWAFGAFIVTLFINIYILSRGLSGGIEKVAKIAMPLLIVFGVILAVRAWTLKTAIDGCADCDPMIGFNFLWEPNLNGIWNFKTWLAAAGQVFFTLSVGMGTIQCYASYLKSKDDVALNAMSAGFMNSFVEVVLGASVVIPIAVGYFGLDWVQQNAGFMMAFQSMPYLFDQWGMFLALLSGVAWFGLLFFAGITSSLAMGTPWMGFMEHEFGWNRNKSAISFGIIVLILALPPIFLFDKGVFDEYDYWTGTVSLVLFAFVETILFSWVFGMNNAWKEITEGADLKIPTIFKFIIKFVTPIFIGIVFLGAIVKPKAIPSESITEASNEWSFAIESVSNGNGWPLADDSILNMIFRFNAEKDAVKYFSESGTPTNFFFTDMSRLLLVVLFLSLCYLVWIASKKREKVSINLKNN
jgi:neurotransmitter:Na+ symporter, NSS family